MVFASSRPQQQDTAARAAARGWLRPLALVAAIVIPAAFVRGCVLDAFAIQQSSMEPMFHGAVVLATASGASAGHEPTGKASGDAGTGDHLLVLRRGMDSSTPQRWDVEVFDGSVDPELPTGVGAMLKRVVGLPDECVRITDGDVYAAPIGLDGCNSGKLALVRKPDELIAGLLVPVLRGAGLLAPWTFAGPGGRSDLPGGGTEIRAGAVPGLAVFEQTVTDGLLDAAGEDPVKDTALEIVVGEGDAILELQLREGANVFRGRLAPAARGGASLHHNLGGGVLASDPAFPGLRAGQRVLLWNVDNGVRLSVDGRPLLGFDYAHNEPQPPGAPERNEPAFAVEGGTLQILEVTVLRDLHYTDRGVYASSAEPPYHVPAGHVFVLGDHSRQSRDSRDFGPVSLGRLRGRPLAIYAPWERAGWLAASGLR